LAVLSFLLGALELLTLLPDFGDTVGLGVGYFALGLLLVARFGFLGGGVLRRLG
jgi:hypothetical protein